MARPSTNLNSRLEKLDAAAARAAKLKRGTKLTAMPMAELLGVRWPTLRDWCDEIGELEASGAVVRGGNGIDWSFDPRRSTKILAAHFRAKIEGQAKKSREITKAIGVNMPAGESAPSFGETKQLVDLTLAVTAAAEKQKQFARADEVADFIDGYNQAVVDGILGVRTKVDPNGNLPPHVRKAVDDHLRSLAAKVHERAAKYIGAQRSAGIQQSGVS